MVTGPLLESVRLPLPRLTLPEMDTVPEPVMARPPAPLVDEIAGDGGRAGTEDGERTVRLVG